MISDFGTKSQMYLTDLDSYKIKYKGNMINLKKDIEEYGKLNLYNIDKLLNNFGLEVNLLSNNENYYKGLKFLDKTKECFNTGRYYLIRSASYIYSNEEINWKSGYGGIYKARTFNCSSSIMWYNNCFDHILLIIYFCCGIDKKQKDYNSLSHEELLSKCRYDNIVKHLKSDINNKQAINLSKLIEFYYNELADIRNLANYIKHKGGIKYKGLEPDSLYKIIINNSKQNTIRESSNFDNICVDLDDINKKLKKAHIDLYKYMDKIVNFLDFENGVSKIII